jgi:hypothetical protein
VNKSEVEKMFDHYQSDRLMAVGKIRHEELLRISQENRLAAQFRQTMRIQDSALWRAAAQAMAQIRQSGRRSAGMVMGLARRAGTATNGQ